MQAILAADIGGTKTRLARLVPEAARLRIVDEVNYPSRAYAGLEDILRDYVGQRSHNFSGLGIGVAGPVVGRRCTVTNLPWEVDGDVLQQSMGWNRVQVLNDLEANAWGIEALDHQDIITLQEGTCWPGNAAIISPGTGLGQAGLYWNGERHRPFASEGGHVNFAPSGPEDCALLNFIRQRVDYVSAEVVLSGCGLRHIYDFLLDHYQARTPPALRERLELEDPAAVISSTALAEEDALCALALATYVRLLGAEAGNQALKIMATGGVYIGGGIAPKILPALRQPEFLAAFRAKGKMTGLMERMPVRVIVNDRAALLGVGVNMLAQSAE